MDPAFASRFDMYRSLAQRSMFSMDLTTTYWMAGFAGALLSILIATRLGRRNALLVAALITLIGDAIEIGSWGRIAAFYVGRFVSGVGTGIFSVVIPIFLAEHSPRAVRGILVSTYVVLWLFGVWLGQWILYGNNLHTPMGDEHWTVPLAVQTAPIFLFAVAMFYCSDTPRSLVLRGKAELTYPVLARMRNIDPSDNYVRDEISAIQRQASTVHRGIFTIFRVKPYRNRMLIAVGLSILKVFSGEDSLGVRISYIFFDLRQLSLQDRNLLSTMLYTGLCFLSAMLFALLVVDGFAGRRKSLLWTIFFQIICLCISGAMGALYANGVGMQVVIYVELAFLYICACVNWFGLGTVPTVYVAEIPDTEMRMATAGIAGAMQKLFYMGLYRALPYMIAYVGQNGIGYGVQFIFAVCCMVAWFFVKKFVPETKGVSLESMSLLFNPSSTSANDPQTNPLADPEHSAAVAKQERENDSTSETDVSERGQSRHLNKSF
ncbi:hypothetical protein PV10_03566 [Exophiala mesophila]|uniref:Major facilitator superfamily (MFS) profile domain-containing protein n=1 Tax=Exophiala mesophila TaxID=212818 RepID=A0A0D1Y5P7_EXOME|nr:uncharacterized protein PV10_03566 [Exophiala mesophila]KIV95981.1 hypothetical protein PV10_03566 [Exophiala mesophila]